MVPYCAVHNAKKRQEVATTISLYLVSHDGHGTGEVFRQAQCEEGLGKPSHIPLSFS